MDSLLSHMNRSKGRSSSCITGLVGMHCYLEWCTLSNVAHLPVQWQLRNLQSSSAVQSSVHIINCQSCECLTLGGSDKLVIHISALRIRFWLYLYYILILILILYYIIIQVFFFLCRWGWGWRRRGWGLHDDYSDSDSYYDSDGFSDDSSHGPRGDECSVM